MKLNPFDRPSPDPGSLTRVTGGLPGDLVGPDDIPAVPPGRTVPPASELEPSTPVPTRLQRLGAAIDRARPGRSGRNVRKWMETIGMLLIVFGFVCILLGLVRRIAQPVPVPGGPVPDFGWPARRGAGDRRRRLRALRLEHASGRRGPAQRAGHRPLGRPPGAHSAQPRRDAAVENEYGHDHEAGSSGEAVSEDAARRSLAAGISVWRSCCPCSHWRSSPPLAGPG